MVGKHWCRRVSLAKSATTSLLPLCHLQVLNFIASAFGVPDSYPLLVPQLAEFHVHYHLLHFTRHYYKLPYAAGQTVAACSKGHIKVSPPVCRLQQ